MDEHSTNLYYIPTSVGRPDYIFLTICIKYAAKRMQNIVAGSYYVLFFIKCMRHDAPNTIKFDTKICILLTLILK
jgi:hypothetical protein